MIRTSMRFDPELMARLNRVADHHGIYLAEVIRECIEKQLPIIEAKIEQEKTCPSGAPIPKNL